VGFSILGLHWVELKSKIEGIKLKNPGTKKSISLALVGTTTPII
jgi:hypothetical protein